MSCDLMSRFRRTLRHFAHANGGNIAMMFALTLVPLVSFIGAAIDYSRAAKARTAMQAALDSTALMLSKDLSSGIITTSQIKSQAQTYFAALYTNKDAVGVTVNATYTQASGSSGSTVQVSGSGSINTDFMKVAGIPNMNFNANSTATYPDQSCPAAEILPLTYSWTN